MNVVPKWFDSEKHSIGRPCKRGHQAVRYKNGPGDCVECAKARAAMRQREKSDEYKAYQKEYGKRNRATLSAASMERERKYKEDPGRAKRIDEVRLAATLRWQADNPGALKANVAKRRASKKQRTPKWANLQAIKTIYENCPDGMTVDHIYPLQGELVSGLHVDNNLQYLTPFENFSKNNRVDPKMLEWVIFK